MATVHPRITLKDGRALAYAEYGDPAGRPVLYFHGFPGSRLEVAMVAEAAAHASLRVVAIDRPGYGRSDFKPGRTLLDWPDDVEQLADALGWDRFVVVGASGGGPYAAVCAFKLPHRLTRVGILCGLGPPESLADADEMLPLNRIGLRMVRRAHWLSKPALGLVGPMMRRHPERMIARLAREVTEPDRRALADPQVRGAFTRSLSEALRQGARGAARDVVIYSSPWGFSLGEIATPVRLWHGEQDVVVPAGMARYLEREIPHARATYYPEEGHFSLVVNRFEEMLGEL